MLKLYIYAAIASLFLAFGVKYHFLYKDYADAKLQIEGYKNTLATAAKTAENKTKQLEKSWKLIQELQDSQQKKRLVVYEKIQEVKVPNDCLRLDDYVGDDAYRLLNDEEPPKPVTVSSSPDKPRNP
jgi:hypothetical protein